MNEVNAICLGSAIAQAFYNEAMAKAGPLST